MALMFIMMQLGIMRQQNKCSHPQQEVARVEGDWRTAKSRGEPTSGFHQRVVAKSWDSEGAPDFQH
jgi:hypothetical protein